MIYAVDETIELNSGTIDKALNGIGTAADKGASAINKATNKAAAAINKATDKAASTVDGIRNAEPHEHGEGKLLPSAYGGASNLIGTISSEIGNMARSVASGVRNSGKAIGQAAKYSLLRTLPKRLRPNSEKTKTD